MPEQSLKKIAERVKGADLSKVNLLPQEGFLFSMIDGILSVADLKIVTRLPENDLYPMLTKLAEMGLIRFREGESSSNSTNNRSRQVVSFTRDDSKISRSFEERVRELYINIDSLDYYTILGVDRRADTKTIKAAYHKLTKEYHPDKLFRRGSDDLRERLQFIFARINDAYKALSKDATRWEYEKSLKNAPPQMRSPATDKVSAPGAPKGAPVPPPRRPPVKPFQPAGPPQQNPFTETILKAKRLYEDALKEMKKKNFSAARQNIRIAMTLDKFNKTYPDMLQKLEELESREQARKYYEQGLLSESSGQIDDAMRSYREATLLDGQNGKYYTKWARILIEHKGNAAQAKTVIQKAVSLGVSDAEASLVLGLVMKEMGQLPQAQAEFERGLKIEPNNKDLQRELKKLKKGK